MKAAFAALVTAVLSEIFTGTLASPKPESWGEEMRAHMKTFEKDRAAMATAKKACDKLKPIVRMDDPKCVAVERREAIDVVRTKRPSGVF